MTIHPRSWYVASGPIAVVAVAVGLLCLGAAPKKNSLAPIESAFRFCSFGDWGAEPDSAGVAPLRQRRVASALMEHGCRKLVLTGDNFYPTGISSVTDRRWEQSFLTPYRALLDAGAQFLVSLGNHDYMQPTSPEAQVQFSRDPRVQKTAADGTGYSAWFMGDSPARYYRKDFLIPGSSRFACFFALDTNQFTSASRAGPQIAWLAASLNQTEHCSAKIAFGHHPIVSSGEHGNGNAALQRLLRPALAGIDVYIAGHDHHTEDAGSYPAIKIPNSVESDRADRVTAAPTVPRFRQIVIGSGGASLYRVPRRAADSRRIVQGMHGFGSFTVRPDKLEIEFINDENVSTYQASMDLGDGS